MYADLLRYYNVDIQDLFDGRITAKRVLALVENLPMESATIAGLRGGQEFRGWDLNAYLVTNVIDLLSWIEYTLTVPHVKNPKSVPQPKPMLRPEDAAGEKQKKSSPESYNPFMAALHDLPQSGPADEVKQIVQIPAEVLARSAAHKESPPFRVT